MTARRDLLAFAAGAVASRTILPITGGAQQPVPDAELLRFGDLFRPARAAEIEAWDLAEGEADDNGPLTRRACALSSEVSAIVDQVIVLSASTLSGLLVKVVALDWHYCGDAPTLEMFGQNPYGMPAADDEVLTVSILSDLRIMAGITSA